MLWPSTVESLWEGLLQGHGWIFDLDGTLIDTPALHAEAFVRAFAEQGRWVPYGAVLDRIGKGGDRLVSEFVPELSPTESKAVRTRHGELVRESARQRGVPVHEGARELVDALRVRGLHIAVATASKQDDLEVMLEASGLALDRLVDVIVSSKHVRRTKPAPDAVEAALDALDLPAERCLLLGDTAWDVETGRHAGVPVVGVATGPHDMRRLLGAGAVRAYRDLHAVRADLDAVLDACFGKRASPVGAR